MIIQIDRSTLQKLGFAYYNELRFIRKETELNDY